MSRGKDVHRNYGYLSPLARLGGRLEVLLFVASGGVDGQKLANAYREFLAKRPEEVRRVLHDLADHGWLAATEDRVRVRFDAVTRLLADLADVVPSYLWGDLTRADLEKLDPVWLRAEVLRFPEWQQGWLQLPLLAAALAWELEIPLEAEA